ncbi:MAG: polyprenyl synthetase family protein [Paludibacteraceae bacterium]|nr:polyprenyl synthetase family protein [Paludibacteraceae bacterium]
MIDINQTIARLDWKKEPYGLYEPIEYTLSAGGKRLRPTLALIACRIYGGKEEDVLPAALALEVFHNFTLLHDDVMDKAEVRRGRPCVHIKWDENTAILSGDQMMIEAYKLLALVKEECLPVVLRMFNRMATEICEGQQWDVEMEHGEWAMKDYLEMIRLKTAVLLANALQTGAYIAGADKEQMEALYEYGIHVGLAFQIQDDYLDCYGDPATFGKAIGGDIREGKHTWMRLTAQEKGGNTDLLDSHDVKAVLDEYTRLGVDKAALIEIARLTEKALSYLEIVPQNEATEQLKELACKLVGRTH